MNKSHYAIKDLSKLSLFDLAMKLNDVNKIKSTREVHGIELIMLDQTWNEVVMELWRRIPSLKQDANIQPVLTRVNDVYTNTYTRKLEKKR